MADRSDEASYIQLTANIVSAYVSNNSVSSAEIPALISQVYSALTRVSNGAQVAAPIEPLKPAVPIKRSITPEYLVCLEDGKKFKSLKRHLRTQYGMTPDQYRAKWNCRRLPDGGTQLCRRALAIGQANGPGPATPTPPRPRLERVPGKSALGLDPMAGNQFSEKDMRQ